MSLHRQKEGKMKPYPENPLYRKGDWEAHGYPALKYGTKVAIPWRVLVTFIEFALEYFGFKEKSEAANYKNDNTTPLKRIIVGMLAEYAIRQEFDRMGILQKMYPGATPENFYLIDLSVGDGENYNHPDLEPIKIGCKSCSYGQFHLIEKKQEYLQIFAVVYSISKIYRLIDEIKLNGCLCDDGYIVVNILGPSNEECMVNNLHIEGIKNNDVVQHGTKSAFYLYRENKPNFLPFYMCRRDLTMLANAYSKNDTESFDSCYESLRNRISKYTSMN
jgi:hypothetical protein